MTRQTAWAPRDARGHFIPATCPECGDQLVFDDSNRWGDPEWHCTGLVDPNDDRLPLQACEFTIGGEFRESSVGLRASTLG